MISLCSKSKPISQFLLSQSPSSKLLFISLFNTSSSSSSHNYPSSSPSRRNDEESKTVRVSVWWDIENCQVPNGVNVFKITHSITSAVRANGIKGPVQVTAFGDVFCLSKPNQMALSSTGVNLVHIPSGGKNSADRSLLVDLMYWVSQNPPPAHIFLISSDRDFAGILHKLRMNNYNILLAGKDGKSTPGVLCSAASIMWHWNELVKGENLSGRHFNQPPDGPFNSWYGYYKGPLEDPYEVSELQSCSVADNSANADLSSESKRRSVPLAVLRQIRHIVSAFPKGISITELRSELIKNKVPMDKDFFGHKKFSKFLQSMPHIIEVDDSCADGQFFLRPASRRVREPVETNDAFVGSMTEKNNQDIGVTRTVKGQANTERTVEKATRETPEKKVTDAPQKDNQVAFMKGLSGEKTSDVEVVEILGAPKEEQKYSDVGLFKRLWTKLLGANTDAVKASNDIPVQFDTSDGNPERSTPGKEDTESTNQYGVQHPAHCSSSNALNNDAERPVHPFSSAASNEDAKSNISDESEASPGFITRLISWCKSWRNPSFRTPTEHSSEEPSLIDGSSTKLDDVSNSTKLVDASHPRKHELFSKDTFWSALHSFLKTRRGLDIVLNSTSREQFAEKLQKEGPLVLRPLQEIDLHHLVDLLVSEKKWIMEFPTKTPRFRVAHAPEESSAEFQPQNVHFHSSNGLSSMFMSSSSSHKKPSEKSRGEVLADCQKLLGELISQNPEGFNMACLKKLFVEKYGYPLDHQKLGYPKLISLLQIMPGIKVESCYVLSDKAVYSPAAESLGRMEKLSGSDSDVSDSPQKNESGESPWEELGPVAKQEKESTIEQENGNYEPSISDDDEFSELEEDDATSSSVKEVDRNRSRANEEDSSLLQILDSWYSTKDETNPQEPGSHAESLADCSKQESESSQSSNTDIESAAASAANYARKQKPQKSYLFVSDPVETKKDKLIDGILGSLKKSGESRMQE
ncbi:Meiosis regulator and mRNA stability factor 1 [Bienertia sinuspersici]